MSKFIHLSCHLHPHPYVAVSGGVDSMVLLHFLSQGKRNPVAVFVNHKTEASTKGLEVVSKFCKDNSIVLVTADIDPEDYEEGTSLEAFWREQRYKVFSRYNNIYMGHHLNDAAENWIMTSLTGQPYLIPRCRELGDFTVIYRPFLLTEKKALYDYAWKHSVPHIEDESNYDLRFRRNLVRHKVMDLALEVNPGFLTTIRNKYLNEIEDEKNLSI